jgi:hypothetical protein
MSQSQPFGKMAKCSLLGAWRLWNGRYTKGRWTPGIGGPWTAWRVGVAIGGASLWKPPRSTCYLCSFLSLPSLHTLLAY